MSGHGNNSIFSGNYTFASWTPIDSNLSQELVEGTRNETSRSNLHSFNDNAIPFLFQFSFAIFIFACFVIMALF